eukprot:1528702-Rhodomonas_salina.1
MATRVLCSARYDFVYGATGSRAVPWWCDCHVQCKLHSTKVAGTHSFGWLLSVTERVCAGAQDAAKRGHGAQRSERASQGRGGRKERGEREREEREGGGGAGGGGHEVRSAISLRAPLSAYAKDTRCSMHSKIKYEKPHLQHNLYQECGFLYLSVQCAQADISYGGMGLCT